jgi:dihydropteroate synthase
MTAAWRVRGRILTPRDGHERPLVVGILNVTPDSFFDGGRHASCEAAVAHGLRLWNEGADMIDVGGESTRPGSTPVDPSEEQTRVVPVVRDLVAQGVVVAIDTRNASTARAALEGGAHALNDIQGLSDPRMLAVAREFQCGACAMHMRGTPVTMQHQPDYQDVVREVGAFLENIALAWEDAGLPPDSLALDPGIGFGKTLEHNQALVRATTELRLRFLPRLWYLGLSRKSFLARTPGVSPTTDRLAGSLGAALASAHLGCDILRVHDVAATLEALAVFRSLIPEPS